MLYITFWSHSSMVGFVGQLADDLTSFTFHCQGGELSLAIKESELTEYTMSMLNCLMADGEASLAGLSQLSK